MYTMKRCVGSAMLVCAMAGCDEPDEADANDDVDVDTDADIDTAPGPVGKAALVSIGLFHNATDVWSSQGGTAFGLIAHHPDDNIINGAECTYSWWALAEWDIPGRWALGCLTSLPDVGSSKVAHGGSSYWRFLDGGDVSAGTVALHRRSFYLDPWIPNPYRVYSGRFTALPTGSAGLTLGGEVIPYAGTDDFTWPDAMVATSPEPTKPVRVSRGDTIDFAWTPGISGDVFLLASVERDRFYQDSQGNPPTYSNHPRPDVFEIHGLDDAAGSYSYEVDRLGFEPPFDSGTVILRRWTNSLIDAAGSTARISAVSDQWYRLEYEDLEGWTELDDTVLADHCSDAAALAPLAAGDYHGDLTGFEHEDHVQYIPFSDWTPAATDGRDGFVRVDLDSGEKLTATLRQAGDDSAIYRLASPCDLLGPGPPYLGGVYDRTSVGGAEVLEHTAAGPKSVYLVLDATWPGHGGVFSLTIEIE